MTEANGKKKRAFILLRHGQDFKKVENVDEPKLWEYDCSEYNEDGVAKCSNKNDHWNYYFKDPKAAKVQLRVRRLNCEGRDQSWKLAIALPKWLDDNNYYPISRVVTKDPRQPNHEPRTQNPFQTVYPLVNALEKDNPDLPYVRLKFMDTMPNEELTYDALIDQRGAYSTVVCWDAQGLWGKKIVVKVNGKDKKQWPPAAVNGSILKTLLNDQVKKVPHKGEDIYIVTYDEGIKSFTVENHLKLTELVNTYGIKDDPGYAICKMEYPGFKPVLDYSIRQNQ